jgi:glutamate-ammonia-ligase adenylyltransferase
LLGLGKLGGREMNYQSDLDLVLLYEADGHTLNSKGETTDNVHFFSELAQRVIKAISSHGPLGRLYQADMRLRPTGKSGSLVVPLNGFRKYHAEGQGQLWERQALTRARIVAGDASFDEAVMEAIHAAAYGPVWTTAMADEIVGMRKKLEQSRGEDDLKRGIGGIVDVEFLVQLLLLKYGREYPGIRQSNLWEALAALEKAGLLDAEVVAQVTQHYDFLRTLESRQRIVQNQSLDSLPESRDDLLKLVRRLGYADKAPEQAIHHFQDDLQTRRQAMRQVFQRVVSLQ